jgi:hypothetical protein
MPGRPQRVARSFCGAAMKTITAITFLSVLILFPAGCMGKHVAANDARNDVDVFGVQLFSDVDYREINGVKAEEEPCLRGYERNFDALDIIIGYGFNGKIRKIMTRNTTTTMFGIRPGTTLDKGRKKILGAGFSETTTPFTFTSNRFSLTFLVDDKDIIFGLTLQALE